MDAGISAFLTPRAWRRQRFPAVFFFGYALMYRLSLAMPFREEAGDACILKPMKIHLHTIIHKYNACVPLLKLRDPSQTPRRPQRLFEQKTAICLPLDLSRTVHLSV
jgi:hypothetical protein